MTAARAVELPRERERPDPLRRLQDLVTRVAALLPTGVDLTDKEFERRHRGILALVWVQAAGILAFGLVQHAPLTLVLAEPLLIAGLGAVAAVRVLAPRFRAATATLALITTSASIVQFSGGTIEAHFHFFVMLAVVAIYQDWIPFLLAILYVAIDHGIVGTLFPRSVYNHQAAIARPWLWALIHAAFVLGEAVALLVVWRIIETTDQQRRSAVERLNDELAAQVEERRRQGERAGEIQRRLLPPASPEIDGYELAGVCMPAQEAGGDFYDWVTCGDGTVELTVADVMGKGVAAAFVMAVLRTALRSATREVDVAGRVGEAAGSLSLGLTEDGLFVTLFHASLDPATGIVRYVDAGHGHCRIRRRSGELVHVRGWSLPLGIRDDEVYQEGVTRLEPGDALVVYSDGLVELADGTVELGDLLAGVDGEVGASQLLSGLMRRIPARPLDDITIVVLYRREEDRAPDDRTVRGRDHADLRAPLPLR